MASALLKIIVITHNHFKVISSILYIISWSKDINKKKQNMLKTNVDKLLDILKEKKEIMISDIAVMLNTTPSNVEKIAKFLEEEKLLTIKYRMMKPYLVYGFRDKRKKEKKKKLFSWGKKKKEIPKAVPKPLPTPLTEKPSLFTRLLKKKVEIPQPIPNIEPLKPIPKLELKPIQPPKLELKKEGILPKLFKTKTKQNKKELPEPFPKLEPLKPVPQPPKLELKPIQPPKMELKPFPKQELKSIPGMIEKEKENLFSRLFKKKNKEKEEEPKIKLTKIKSPLFSFKKEKEELNEVKEAIQKAKGIRLERKQIKPFFSPLKMSAESRPVELKTFNKKINIETEEDIKRELDDIIQEIKKKKKEKLQKEITR